MSTTKQKPLDKGPEWFQKLFEKHAHKDDWGVQCTYDYAAWRIVKAAMRRQRVAARKKYDAYE